MTYLLIFIISTILVYVYRRFALQYGILDAPNHRTSHVQVTPSGAGIVFISIWLIMLCITYRHNLLSQIYFFELFIPTLMIATVSFFDDYFNLRKRYRLLTHFAAAFIALYFIGPAGMNLGSYYISYSILLLVIYAFYIVWSINLYNFMDGLDGLAATQAIFIFIVSGILLMVFDAPILSYLSMLLAFSILGFLVWNWPVAKIFMGDVGSTSIGLLVALFSISSQRSTSISFLIYIMLYLPFIYDTTITLLRRVIRCEKWYEPHHQQGIHRLYSHGWSHRKVLLSLIVLDSFILILVIGSVCYPDYLYSLFLIDLMVVGYLYYGIECINPMVSQNTVSAD